MKKHLSRAIALLLAVIMVLTVLPAAVFATEKGEGASAMNGLPADGAYGVVYACGSTYSSVMGADIASGTAPAYAVELTEDGEAIKSLPNGTAIIKFIKNSDGTYYMMLGDKYFALESDESVSLHDKADTGTKWEFVTDQGGMSGAFNIKNTDVKYNGKPTYIEYYSGTLSGWTYKGTTPELYQFKFFETSADEDGRVGVLQEPGALPEDGSTVVIYNAEAAGVMGQPIKTEAENGDVTIEDMQIAAATVVDNTLDYNDIADGALLFKVSVKGSGDSALYTFKTGDQYLAMTDNTTGEYGSNEKLLLVDEETAYTQWTMSAIDGGWLITNKTAAYKGTLACIEYFGTSFSGWTYKNDGSNGKYAMSFYAIEDKYDCGHVVNPSVTFEDFTPSVGVDCDVKYTVSDLNELAETTASYWFDSESGAKKTAEVTYNKKVGTFTIPAADILGHSKLYIDVQIKDAMDIVFHGEKEVDITDVPVISALYPAASSATGDEKRPQIGIDFVNAMADPKIVLKLDGKEVKPTVSGEKATYKPTEDLAEGKHTVYASVTRSDGKMVEKNWAFFIGEGGAMLYFGQIHSHTAEYSDGAGTLEQAFEHSYEADDVDFMIVTDHSNYFDTTKKNSTASYYDLSTLAASTDGTTTKWEEARKTAAEYNEKYNGELVCAYGYEMTWSGGPGHTNSFNTYGTVSRNNTSLNNKTNYAGMLLYNDLMVYANQGKDIDGNDLYNEDGTPKTEGVRTKYIESAPVISQFNHPGTTFGNFGDFTGCTALRDSVLNLVEVGNGEGKVGGSSYWPSISEYDLALSQGWHVAPTNNQDNHKGNWGDSNTCRDVILTADFSEEGIYHALSERHCYSTEDQNFEIYYTLTANGKEYAMGDIATISKEEQPKQVTLNFQISDPDSKDVIGTVYVIGENGQTLASKSYTGNSCKDTITVNNTAAYYYLKVVQKDGQIAVTAPVWTSESTPVNVSVSTDAAVAVQGTKENIIASITNGSESETVTVARYSLYIDGKKVSGGNINEDLKPGKEKEITVPYTPKVDANGKDYEQKITVYFDFTYKGEPYTFDASMKELVINAKNAIYVGIDRGHTNFYVSGDYANCETSFIQICADNGIICEYIKEGQMTKENLTKYDMIVITTPRVSDSVPPTVFTEAELKALKYYAISGGSIINLGKSDRYDFDKELGAANGYPVEDDSIYASAYLNNQINEAVGSKTRFADGIVVDNTWKTNEAYRINFYNNTEKKINLFAEDPFTEGMVTMSNGIYQFYNGTSVIIADGDEKNVKTLVKGYDTSWVTSYTECFTGSAYVPDYAVDPIVVSQGKVNLVTREKLEGGGFLICSGTTFISTYDLKTGVTDPEQYANYIMVMNILNFLKNGEENVGTITPINTVHAGGANGKEYTIEGWVTSNASDYDVDTAFFDCIYAQDANRGINLFPVSGNYYIGEKIRAHGAATEYCGEIELNLSPDHHGSIKVISNTLKVIAPKAVSCKTAMADSSIGNLMKISGIVKKIHKTEGVVDYIYVDDGSGELGVLFINNYIMKDYKGLDDIKVGMAVTGVGIGSRDVDENSTTGAFIKRLRVRNRSEITAYWDPCGDYIDINRSAWYHPYVDFVIEEGLMGSTSTTVKKFEPGASVSRAMIATIMYNIAANGAKVTYSGKFTDVQKNQWFAKAIEWCAQNGLASGKGDGRFDPNGKVTRQELAIFMYALAKFMGYDVSGQADLTKFPDYAQVPSWSKKQLAWAVDYGILSGQNNNGKTVLNPLAYATRAELAAILKSFITNLNKLDNKNDLVILYTNDVHCGVDNNETSFGYAGLAAYKKQMEKLHNNVGLVDCGDAVQGEAIGTLSKGEYLVDLMNYLGYEVGTFGNHEFDYGMDQLAKLVEKADMEYVSANFQYIGEGEGAVDPAPYTIKTYGDTKIAYVGVATPESLVKSTPTYFQDEDGNWIYSFANGGNGQELYDAVQAAVNEAAKEEPDYIIALAHLGDDEVSKPWRSADLIANTTGIDVVLDGHSHSVIPGSLVKNADGEDVLLTSTGTKLANIGKLTIAADGSIRSELIGRDGYNEVDADTQKYLDSIKAQYNEIVKQVVAHADVDLVVNNPDTGIRAVRYRETNLGDVCADAYRYVMDSDIAFVNGGGIRADIKAGDITYEQILAVHPFGNAACVVKASGAQILDALEMAARAVTCDATTGKIDGELGGFLQVSGIKFTINTAIESTVVTDTAAMFQEVTGDRRVMEVMVYNKDLDKYEPIDTDKTYLLASHNYMLKEGGDGLNMFMGCELVQDETKLDNQVLIEYMGSDEFKAHDYSDWTGEGRIKIINDPEYVPSYKDETEKGYALSDVTKLRSGDKVVIYNPVYGKAISTDMADGYHIKAVVATPVKGLMENPADNIIWTVTKNADGSFSFTNGNKGIYSYISGTYYDLATSNSGSYDGSWTITAMDAVMNSYTMASVATPDLFMEYYAPSFSAFKQEAPTTGEYGYQFYRYGNLPDCEHNFVATSDAVAPTCTDTGIGTYKCSKCNFYYAETTPATGHKDTNADGKCDSCGTVMETWKKASSIAAGDTFMIVVGGMAATETAKGNGFAPDEAVISGDILTPKAGYLKLTAEDAGDGSFYLKNSAGQYLQFLDNLANGGYGNGGAVGFVDTKIEGDANYCYRYKLIEQNGVTLLCVIDAPVYVSDGYDCTICFEFYNGSIYPWRCKPAFSGADLEPFGVQIFKLG